MRIIIVDAEPSKTLSKVGTWSNPCFPTVVIVELLLGERRLLATSFMGLAVIQSKLMTFRTL